MKTPTDHYGDTEGPLGLRMSSDQAVAAEAVLKDLSAECRAMVADGPMRATVMPKKIETDSEERTEVSLVTTNSVDRDREVILPGGGDWKGFRLNPTVTFAHKYDELPLGRALWVRRQKPIPPQTVDGWLAKTLYASKPEGWEAPWLADAVFHLIQQKFLPGKSIGFIPMEMRAPEEKEIEERPELAKVGAIITKWHALEYAVAPVQSNPDALVQEVAKCKAAGMTCPEVLLDELGLVLCAPCPVIEVSSTPAKAAAPLKSSVPAYSKAEMAQYIGKTIGAHGALLAAQVPTMVQEALDKLRGKV